MRIFFKKMFIVSGCFFVFLQSHAMGPSGHFCDKAKLVVSKFVDSKSNEDWDVVEVNAYNLKHCQCEMAPVFYHIYRMKVLFPNSQTLKGTSPNEFVARQKLSMDEQINTLKHCDQKKYGPLIGAMIQQYFDTDISQSARNLMKKINE